MPLETGQAQPEISFIDRQHLTINNGGSADRRFLYHPVAPCMGIPDRSRVFVLVDKRTVLEMMADHMPKERFYGVHVQSERTKCLLRQICLLMRRKAPPKAGPICYKTGPWHGERGWIAPVLDQAGRSEAHVQIGADKANGLTPEGTMLGSRISPESFSRSAWMQ